MEVQQTSDDAGHHHLVVLDQQAGLTTVAAGHRHPVRFDPMLGWGIQPAADGHTHTLIPLVRSTTNQITLTRRKEAEVVEDVRLLDKTARELEKDFVTKGQQSHDFVAGEMWTKDEKSVLNTNELADAVINEIEPKIDLLSGYQRQNRFDTRFYPTEGGDVVVASILTELWKDVAERNGYDHQESRVFDDGQITGRGLFQMRIDRSEDISGRIVIEHFPWDGARFGEHAQPDQSDLEYVVKRKRFSVAKAAQLWPEHATRLEQLVRTVANPATAGLPSAGIETDASDDALHARVTPDQYEAPSPTAPIAIDQDAAEFVDVAKKEIVVIECQRRVYLRIPVLHNAQAEVYLNGNGIAKADLDAVARDIPGFRVDKIMVSRMRISTIAYTVKLEDDFAQPGEDDFTLIPFYAKKHGTRIWGKVEPMKYPNREINRLHQKFLDVIDKAGGYGWFSEPDTFANPAEKTRFDEDRNKAGFHVQITNLDRQPQKVEGVKFPIEIANAITLTSEKLKEISNIIPEMLGINSRAESGKAIDSKKQQGLIGNEYLFDNLRLTKTLLARRFLKKVPVVFTPTKIMRIIANIHQTRPVKLMGVAGHSQIPPGPMPVTMSDGPQIDMAEGAEGNFAPAGPPAPGMPAADPMAVGTPFSALTPLQLEAITRILTEADYSAYDVRIGESTANPTTRQANFDLAIELIQKIPGLGTMVLDLVLNMSDFPEKDEWLARIRQYMAAMAAQPTDQATGTKGRAARNGTPVAA